MLFASANCYAPGEAGTPADLGAPQGQNVSLLGRYTQAFQQLSRPTRLWVGIAGLVVVVLLMHKYGGRR